LKYTRHHEKACAPKHDARHEGRDRPERRRASRCSIGGGARKRTRRTVMDEYFGELLVEKGRTPMRQHKSKQALRGRRVLLQDYLCGLISTHLGFQLSLTERHAERRQGDFRCLAEAAKCNTALVKTPLKRTVR
jgi:hypothetical protein